MRHIHIALCTLLIAGCAGTSEVEGERVTVENGEVRFCGEGNGLPECRDYNNLTYGENLKYRAPTDDQLAEEASKVRAESPQELEETISELEQSPGLIEDTTEE
jgi:hypothetical protein